MENKDDIRVAEILGWELGKMDSGESEFYSNPSDVCIAPGGRGWQAIPSFTTDPAADYKVLEWLRKHGMDIQEVRSNIMTDKDNLQAGKISYRPGDFSRALLELDKEGLLK